MVIGNLHAGDCLAGMGNRVHLQAAYEGDSAHVPTTVYLAFAELPNRYGVVERHA